MDRLREVDDGAVALVVIVSSVSRQSRPQHRPHPLDLAQRFGDQPRPGADAGVAARVPDYCQLSRPGNV